MQLRQKLMQLFALSLSLTSASFAAEKPQWEFWSGSLGSVSFIDSGKILGSTTLVSVLALPNYPWSAPRAGYFLTDDLQIVLSPYYQMTSGPKGASDTSNYSILAGANYSFLGKSFDDSFFAEIKLGLFITSNTASFLNFQWQVSAGKRFPITDLVPHLHYAPAITYYSMAHSFTPNAPLITQSAFSIIPLQVSLSL